MCYRAECVQTFGCCESRPLGIIAHVAFSFARGVLNSKDGRYTREGPMMRRLCSFLTVALLVAAAAGSAHASPTLDPYAFATPPTGANGASGTETASPRAFTAPRAFTFKAISSVDSASIPWGKHTLTPRVYAKSSAFASRRLPPDAGRISLGGYRDKPDDGYPPPIPAPGAWILASVGTLAVGWLRGRRIV